jgi:hypothetical protein
MVAGAALALGGFGLGQWVRLDPSPPAPERVTHERVVVSEGRGGTCPGATEELRALVREELGPRATAPPVVDEPDPEPTPQSVELRALVDRALAAGRWTQADRVTALGLLAGVRPDERRVLSVLVYSAVNAGRLRVETQGPPF